MRLTALSVQSQPRHGPQTRVFLNPPSGLRSQRSSRLCASRVAIHPPRATAHILAPSADQPDGICKKQGARVPHMMQISAEYPSCIQICHARMASPSLPPNSCPEPGIAFRNRFPSSFASIQWVNSHKVYLCPFPVGHRQAPSRKLPPGSAPGSSPSNQSVRICSGHPTATPS